MYVVDFLRKTKESSLIVPPFHTGQLGLLPETDVYVSLMEGRPGIEVVIRPFQSNGGNLTHVACTMYDQPGVVRRLVDAVSELGVNIVNLVSCAIDHLERQAVDMVIDWTGS